MLLAMETVGNNGTAWGIELGGSVLVKRAARFILIEEVGGWVRSVSGSGTLAKVSGWSNSPL